MTDEEEFRAQLRIEELERLTEHMRMTLQILNQWSEEALEGQNKDELQEILRSAL